MEATENEGRWLPVLIQNDTTGAGIEGIAFNAATLSVKYQKQGGAVTTLVLTADNWLEGQKGAYSVYFPDAAFSVAGEFLYWAVYTGATDYHGAVDVVPALDEGPVVWTITAKDSYGNIDPGARLWLTDDAAGTTVIRRIKTADDAGQVTFHLESGHTYWIQGIGSDGEELTAVELEVP